MPAGLSIEATSAVGVIGDQPMSLAKARLGLDDARLGLALLVSGGASMLSMPFMGWLAHLLVLVSLSSRIVRR